MRNQRKDWYFIKLIPSGVKNRTSGLSHYLGTIYGYTSNRWIAGQYLQSLKQFTKNENDSSFSDIPCDVSIVHFSGTIESFHEMIKREYGCILTGEDILEVFQSSDNTPLYSLPLESYSIISTCGDILGGKLDYVIEHFLLEKDCTRLYWILRFLIESLDADIFRFKKNVFNDLITVLYDDHPLLERYFIGLHNAYEYYENPFIINKCIDVVRYSIFKGRFLPL